MVMMMMMMKVILQERVGSQNFFRNRKISSETPEFFSGFSKTQMHLGDKKAQRARRNYTQNKAPLSENVMKEGERVLFQPWN